MATQEEARKPSGIQSLARAATILEQIARHRDGIALAQLAKAVGLHSSTTFHLAKTLVGLGYVRQNETTKLYRIGPMIFRLASAAFDEVELASTAAPFLDSLVIRTGEKCQLAIRQGTEAVVVLQQEAPGAFRLAEATGVARPMHATAIGKALLAAFTPENLDLFLDRLPLEPLTQRTITDRGRLAEEIARVRQVGLAHEEGEFHPEIRCFAVPVRNFGGEIVASVGISAPLWRVAREDQQRKLAALAEVAEELSAAFGDARPERQPVATPRRRASA
jgi:DNA-binding IclR family transcriptional regulator